MHVSRTQQQTLCQPPAAEIHMGKNRDTQPPRMTGAAGRLHHAVNAPASTQLPSCFPTVSTFKKLWPLERSERRAPGRLHVPTNHTTTEFADAPHTVLTIKQLHHITLTHPHHLQPRPTHHHNCHARSLQTASPPHQRTRPSTAESWAEYTYSCLLKQLKGA